MKIQSIYLISVFVCFTLAVPYKESQTKKHRNKNKLKPKEVSDHCLSVCDDSTAYPIKTIKRLIKRKKNMPLFSKTSLIESSGDASPKVRDSNELENLCRTKTVTTTPKQGFDFLSGQRRFIVNVNNSVQTLVYETCVEPEQPCIDEKQMPFSYGTQCTQKYNMVRLVSLSPLAKLEYGKFKVPSTCVCSYNRNAQSINNEVLPFL